MALTCAIDICCVAAYVDPDLGEIILPGTAADVHMKSRYANIFAYSADAKALSRVR